MSALAGFIVGLLVGGPMGFAAAAIVLASGRDDWGDWDD